MERDKNPRGECAVPSTTYRLNEAARESAKIMGVADRKTYIENSPEKSVVLSPRLEELIREVGGCQTEQLAALVRRVMYEFLSR